MRNNGCLGRAFKGCEGALQQLRAAQSAAHIAKQMFQSSLQMTELVAQILSLPPQTWFNP